jgi:hypothetical protein
MDIREAAYSGNIQALRELIDEQGADVNEPNKVNGWTRTLSLAFAEMFFFNFHMRRLRYCTVGAIMGVKDFAIIFLMDNDVADESVFFLRIQLFTGLPRVAIPTS